MHLSVEDTLSGEEVLPGFTCPGAEVSPVNTPHLVDRQSIREPLGDRVQRRRLYHSLLGADPAGRLPPSVPVKHRATGSPRYLAVSWSCPSSVPARMRTLVIRGHLADELLEDRVGEGLVALGCDDEGARAADHVASEIAIEIRFQRQDR